MAHALLIETSTPVCSVAFSHHGEVIAHADDDSGRLAHAERLNGMIAEVMDHANSSFKDLSYVAVSEGPGSYTGLRIGLSTAKGLCFARNVPLILVPSLDALTWHYAQSQGPLADDVLLFPAIDARRMEIYTRPFTSKIEALGEVEAKVIDALSFQNWSEKHSIHLFGDGADKLASTLTHPNIDVVTNFRSSARGLATPAYQKFRQNLYSDLAYSEPFYLKEFRAGLPKTALGPSQR